MPLSNLDHKKIYYYVLCVMAFFVLMWGTVDLASSSISLISLKGTEQGLTSPPARLPDGQAGEAPLSPSDKNEQLVDAYYQSKMLSDRFWDSLARVIISSLIFAYCRFTVNKLEKQA